jgi:hypothetical protein
LKLDDAAYAVARLNAADPLVLDGVRCYAIYATAHSRPASNGGQTARGVFEFDLITGTWKVLHYSGSDGWCQEYLPENIAVGLGGC